MTPNDGVLSSLRRALWARRGTVALLVFYVALRAVLGFTSGEHGLVTPEGRINPSYGALAIFVLSLRITVLFLVVPSLVYAALAAAVGARLYGKNQDSRSPNR